MEGADEEMWDSNDAEDDMETLAESIQEKNKIRKVEQEGKSNTIIVIVKFEYSRFLQLNPRSLRRFARSSLVNSPLL
jgi:hypothetical protein